MLWLKTKLAIFINMLTLFYKTSKRTFTVLNFKCCNNCFCSTMVDCSTYIPESEGSIPSNGTGRENEHRNVTKLNLKLKIIF
jgi:hypothetical protein